MIKTIAGTKDTLPGEIEKWQHLETIVRRTMELFNYNEIRTPVFEETVLFSRGIGEATDIVSKEMYTFQDRSENSVTLKPEMTAPVVRSVLQHSLDKQQQLNKLYYISPMFRQERPQAGRFRQFHQFGAEALGITSPALDAEMIILAYDILKQLGLKDLSVKINSLGIPESREKYKVLLREYLSDKKDKLTEESRNRMDTNILRLFDSKVESDQEVMRDAPLLLDHLDAESLEQFEKVKEILAGAEIQHEIDPKLVRGLDYYTHTTFEIISGSVGAQSALCGGGRYDLLADQIGDRNVPGVGFAAGIERILLACENENSLNLEDDSIDLYIVRLNKELDLKVNETALFFRRNNLSTELDYLSRSVKAQMREANRLKAKFVLFVGGDEYEQGKVRLKEMSKGEETEMNFDVLNKILEMIVA
jgi:histidyl-tRNA synthetase